MIGLLRFPGTDGMKDPATNVAAHDPRDCEVPRTRWLRVRISMRALMVVVLVISVGLAWHIHQVREQRLAVQAILAQGGTVEYDYRYDAVRDRRLPNGRSWCPVWLQGALDDNFFHNVAVVGLDGDASGRKVSTGGCRSGAPGRAPAIEVLIRGRGSDY